MAFGKDLNFNLFSSMHGGETGADGKLTQRGQNDFFAPFWDQNNPHMQILNGNYDWNKLLKYGSDNVLLNPAGQFGDPGEFLTTAEIDKTRHGGGISDRTATAAAIAATIVGAAFAAGGAAAGEGAGAVSSAAEGGEGGAVAGELGGASTAETPMWTGVAEGGAESGAVDTANIASGVTSAETPTYTGLSASGEATGGVEGSTALGTSSGMTAGQYAQLAGQLGGMAFKQDDPGTPGRMNGYQGYALSNSESSGGGDARMTAIPTPDIKTVSTNDANGINSTTTITQRNGVSAYGSNQPWEMGKAPAIVNPKPVSGINYNFLLG